jgi:hypothetical protein
MSQVYAFLEYNQNTSLVVFVFFTSSNAYSVDPFGEQNILGLKNKHKAPS